MVSPTNVEVLRTLGHGRAAQAQLVDATMPDGRVVRCVEKVFAPGLLTRVIYRLSFQSPFAYQSNRDAILACFYRRKVAAAVIDGSDVVASIADPLYVRFDEPTRAWVLAAQWIDGRGVKPAPADGSRIRNWFSSLSFRKNTAVGLEESTTEPSEIECLVDTMEQLESALGESGLVGSGWQVAPRALVSTANLLRVDDKYTIIDLESGIPAVLVPKYVLSGWIRWALPPFDDLDETKLAHWISQNERLLTFRIGPERVANLQADALKLIAHSSAWKNSEVALFRRPWRWITPSGVRAYQLECYRRWEQDGIADPETARSLPDRPILSRLIWSVGMFPSPIGRVGSRLLARKDARERLKQCLCDRAVLAQEFSQMAERRKQRWVDSGRIAPVQRMSKSSYALNFLLSRITPSKLHRFLVDGKYRMDAVTTMLLLILSSRYQAWFGHRRIAKSIDRWEATERISAEEALDLRQDLSGREVRAYTRGFGMHLALKIFAPIVLPAKVGGVAAFIASGNPWFLAPILITPAMRTAVTLASWWTTRKEHVPHGEALVSGLLPVIGSVAFPLQMFATRPKLSTFLIRDAASMVGRRLPIYGGADSRTEIAMIRWTDYLVEFMQCTSQLVKRIFGANWERKPASTTPTIKLHTRNRLGRWVDNQVAQRIAADRRSDEQTGTDTRSRHRAKQLSECCGQACRCFFS